MAQPISVLGIDIAKRVFHVVWMDDAGHVGLRKRLARRALLTFFANVPPLRIGMEAWGSAHDWARCRRAHGHDVRLIAPQFVTASVKSPKHEARDAEAICEAVTRPTRRFVPIKRVEQQDLQALHRIRERLITARTALVAESVAHSAHGPTGQEPRRRCVSQSERPDGLGTSRTPPSVSIKDGCIGDSVVTVTRHSPTQC